MIKLSRPERPATLTDAIVQILTDEFKTSGIAVWRRPDILDALLSMSRGKCAYCEALIREESKYMEVDHFYCKAIYPDRVVEWENLLPSCKRCNVRKGSHDVGTVPIIDPALNEPSDHLRIINFHFRGKSPLGTETVDALHLNDPDRLVLKRYQIGSAIHTALDGILVDVKAFNSDDQTRSGPRNKLVARFETLISECVDTSPYSASSASALVADPIYADVIDLFRQKGLWTADLKELANMAGSIALL